jgi:hypothetical protein
MYRDILGGNYGHVPGVCHSREPCPDKECFQECIRLDEGLMGCRQPQSNSTAAAGKRKAWILLRSLHSSILQKKNVKAIGGICYDKEKNYYMGGYYSHDNVQFCTAIS